MEGSREVVVSSSASLVVEAPGNTAIELGAGRPWTLRWKTGTSAVVTNWVQVDEVAFSDAAELERKTTEWVARGKRTKAIEIGIVYPVGTVIIDTRRKVLVIDEFTADESAISALQAEILRRFSVRTSRFEEVKTKATCSFELRNAFDQPVQTFEEEIVLKSPTKSPIEIKRVEYGVGYDFHNFEDRSYRGALRISPDRNGKLAVVNEVELEDLMQGLVPSEIFAKAHPEALKAQAVTARSEVLAKLGTKHLVDPYLLCSEQHCAVYKGVSAEKPSTNQAVAATRGEALFSKDGVLVDAVYSSMCGGHTESNEFAWGTPPNPHLRGKPDVIGAEAAEQSNTAQWVKRLLEQRGSFACRMSSFTQPSKLRWEKRFTQAEIDARLSDLSIGTLKAFTIVDRGVSGRATIVTLSGERSATSLRGELNIRKRFGNLQSSLFEVSPEKNAKGEPVAWVFQGAGWGHGVGMCQMGAIGRAEAGHSYRQILDHYFSGARVERMY